MTEAARLCQQPQKVIEVLLPVIMLVFACSVSAKDAFRSLDCYECEDTQYTASNAHMGAKECAGSPLPKRFLVNQTGRREEMPWEKEKDNIVCEVMLTILEHEKDPKIKTYELTRDLRTESYYDELDKKKFPMTMKSGEKVRCVQLGKDKDKFVWKTCYCFTNACNDISFEKLRDMKIAEVYEAPPIYVTSRTKYN